LHGPVAVDPPAPGDHQQGHAGWHEVADLSGDAQAQLVCPCELHQPPCIDEADVAGELVQDRELLLARFRKDRRRSIRTQPDGISPRAACSALP
jgi:hypothetical protein